MNYQLAVIIASRIGREISEGRTLTAHSKARYEQAVAVMHELRSVSGS